MLHGGLLLVSFAGAFAYVTFTGDFQNIGRFLTSSLNSSTLLGRLLYWQDGIKILMDYPMGCGWRGYSFLQGLYQTGVYEVRYIHNDYLQLMLDGGILPGLLFLILIVKEAFARIRYIRRYTGLPSQRR